jgi:hypothetical protein
MGTTAKIIGATFAAAAAIGGGVYAAAETLDTTKTEESTFGRSVERVVIKADSGDIEVVRGGRSVEIRETRSYVLDSPDVTKSIEDGVLTIESECGGVLSIVCETDFRIAVPKGVPVDARTYVGDIEIDGIAASSIEARGYAGDIDVRAARRSDVTARTNVGDVDVEVPRGDYEIDAEASVGDSDVDGLTAADRAKHRIKAQSDVGTVDVAAAAR